MVSERYLHSKLVYIFELQIFIELFLQIKMEEKGLCDYMKNVKYKFIRDLHESFIQINDIKFDSLWHPALTDNKNSILNWVVSQHQQ